MKILFFFILSWNGDAWRAMSRSEILSKANQMIDGAWTPQHNQRGWTSSRSPYHFYAGRTYHGVLYSQNNPVEDWDEFRSRIRTARAYYGYWSGGRWYNKLGNDCSGFVSIAWGMPGRYTTVGFYNQANKKKQYVIAIGRAGQAAHVDLKPGDALNYSGHHIILINRRVTNGVQSLEQTPNNAKRRRWYYSSLSRYQPIRRKDLTDAPQDTIKTEVEFEHYPTQVRPEESFSVLVKATVKNSDAPADLFLEVKDKETGRILWSRKIENISSGSHDEQFSGISLPDRGENYYVYFMATLTPDGGSWSNRYDYATTYYHPTLVGETSGGDGGDGGDGGSGGNGGGADGHGSDIPDPGSSFADAYTIGPGTYTQYLDSVDVYDYYKFMVHEGESITITVIPPENADFDIGLYDPSYVGRANGVEGEGHFEKIGYIIDTTGYWYLQVLRHSGEGNYTLILEIDTIKPAWTVMVYLNADNELGSADAVINSMEAAKPSPHVNVLVEYDLRNGGTKIYKIKGDSDPSKINSPVVRELGERNMGDASTLVDFVDWAHREYDAGKYALIIKSTGGGWSWISNDLSSGDSIEIPTGELKSALSRIKGILGKKLEVLTFDASLTGMWEVMDQVKDYANYFVSSEENIPSLGINYGSFINVQPATDGAGLAGAIVSSAQDAPVLSAVNLSKIENLTEKINLFARLLFSYKNTYGDIIDTIRGYFNGNSENHEYGYDPRLNNHDFIDLYRFSYFVSSSSLPSDVRDAARDVMNAISEAVISMHAGSGYSNDSHGISIYYPKDPEDYNHTPFGGNYDDLITSRNTQWDEFIKQKGEGDGSDYTLTTTTFNWINTSTPTGINGDDQSKEISLPFTFTFYGKEYRSVYVCSNGFLSFTSSSTPYNPQAIPEPADPNAVVAPLWRDLDAGKAGNITYYAGADKFVVTYDGVSNRKNDSRQTFQVILYPDGEIVFQYRDVTNDQTTTIGLENEDGTKGKTAGFPSNGTAYRWIPTSKSTKSIKGSILYISGVTLSKTAGRIEFSTVPSQMVKVVIYNALGQKLYDNTLMPERVVNFSHAPISRGIYFVEIHAGALKEQKKIMILE